MCASQKAEAWHGNLGPACAGKPSPTYVERFNAFVLCSLHCVCILQDKKRKSELQVHTFSTTGGMLLNVDSFFYSVIHSSQEEAFKRASARREVWQYRFLCLSAM